MIGANGFTLRVQNEDFIISYSHVSPNFIVSVGDYVCKEQIIGYVGPKYIEKIKNNPYTDLNGKYTNGATTGSHLHFAIKKSGKYVNPMEYLLDQKK